jgi:hypothetical protein
MVLALMFDRLHWRAERRTSVVTILEAPYVPAPIGPVLLLVDERHIARSTTFAILFSKDRAVGASDNRLVPRGPRGCFVYGIEGVEVASHLTRHFVVHLRNVGMRMKEMDDDFTSKT